jgi:adenine C2-methylase RlmN of 23S rRNA A2503 and tRNA A37
MGLKGDLTAGEIIEQLLHAQQHTTIKNVVFMVRGRI